MLNLAREGDLKGTLRSRSLLSGGNGPTFTGDPGSLSEGLRYHVEQELEISENVYRPFSEAWLSLFREARQHWSSGRLGVSERDAWLLETDLGELARFEGREVPLDLPFLVETEENDLDEAEYQGRDVKLNKPMRNSGSGGKYAVYVKDPKTKNVKRVTFGDKGMKVKIRDPERRKSFAARHQCEKKNDKTKAGYWSCRLPRYAENLGMGKMSYKWW